MSWLAPLGFAAVVVAFVCLAVSGALSALRRRHAQVKTRQPDLPDVLVTEDIK